jgi:hypothetical protein
MFSWGLGSWVKRSMSLFLPCSTQSCNHQCTQPGNHLCLSPSVCLICTIPQSKTLRIRSGFWVMRSVFGFRKGHIKVYPVPIYLQLHTSTLPLSLVTNCAPIIPGHEICLLLQCLHTSIFPKASILCFS